MHHRIVRHGTIDSTSERAFAALADGSARHGDVHVAEAQTRGRGRLGRAWHSAIGEGLYASVVLLPERPLPPAALTIAAGLAVHDAVVALGLVLARLKWPNDVVVHLRDQEDRDRDGVARKRAHDVATPTRECRSELDRSIDHAADGRTASPQLAAKLSGILVETRGLSLDRPHYVVGIGVNVAQRSFPPELLAERPVTSLLACGVSTTVDDALSAILRALPPRLDAIERAPTTLARDYAAATRLIAGAHVEIEAGDEVSTGRVRAFDVERGVDVVLEDGRERRWALELVKSLRLVDDER